MTDLEKTIRGLECCRSSACPVDCPYLSVNMCIPRLCDDAIALLREQEPVKPIKREDLLFCGGCKTAIYNFLNYCPRCGKKVDWDV